MGIQEKKMFLCTYIQSSGLNTKHCSNFEYEGLRTEVVQPSNLSQTVGYETVGYETVGYTYPLMYAVVGNTRA